MRRGKLLTQKHLPKRRDGEGRYNTLSVNVRFFNDELKDEMTLNITPNKHHICNVIIIVLAIRHTNITDQTEAKHVNSSVH